MNMMKQFNEAMAYIEDNLIGEIDFRQVARIAECSEYHFRRMFSFLAGMSLGEYIRRRKFSFAAILLQSKRERVIDVAFALGYETPEAFSKAFQMVHGVNPSQVKKGSAKLKSFPPMTFQLTMSGGIEIDYRIVEKDAFQIAGFKKRVTLQFEGMNPQIEELAQKLTPEVVSELKSLCDIEPTGIINVSANFSDRTIEGSALDQYVGVATTRSVPKGYDCLQVKAHTWAVFGALGAFPHALQETWGKIYSEWNPTSGYELVEGPEILWNESTDISKKDYRSDIWVPVRKIYVAI